MSEERRREDKRIEEIAENVQKIHDVLLSEQGVCVRLSVAERSIEATQKELTDHKSNHWQFAGIIVTAAGVVVAAFEWLMAKMK